MNIWLVRFICAPLSAVFIILLAIKFEGYEETESTILKIFCLLGLITVLALWGSEESNPRK